MLSKALVVGAYQKKAEELAALPGVELTVAVPPVWREPGVGDQVLELRFVRGYQLAVLPIWLNGRHHVHFYPAIERLLAQLRPDVFHIDEESFNFATYQAMRAGVRYGARCCFYNWATVDRRYPPPFGWFEQYAFRHAAHAIAGVQEAAEIMRRMGLRSCVLVSDGYHIFRAKKMMQAEGITVYGSPRASAQVGAAKEYWLYLKQAVGYALWKIGISV